MRWGPRKEGKFREALRPMIMWEPIGRRTRGRCPGVHEIPRSEVQERSGG